MFLEEPARLAYCPGEGVSRISLPYPAGNRPCQGIELRLGDLLMDTFVGEDLHLPLEERDKEKNPRVTLCPVEALLVESPDCPVPYGPFAASRTAEKRLEVRRPSHQEPEKREEDES